MLRFERLGVSRMPIFDLNDVTPHFKRHTVSDRYTNKGIIIFKE